MVTCGGDADPAGALPGWNQAGVDHGAAVPSRITHFLHVLADLTTATS